MTTVERDKLLQMVQMFAFGDGNSCWPTVKRWTFKEAKEALREQANRAEIERRAVADDLNPESAPMDHDR